MAINLASLRRSTEDRKPGRLLIHATQGVGKTTFAVGAPDPVVIQCEDGLASVDVQAFPLATSYTDVMDAITTLYQDEHAFKSVIVDSVDWLEPLILTQACIDNGWKNIEEPGFGKGYVAAMSLWRQYLDGLNALRNERGMWVIQIAHTDVKKYSPPDGEPYDRYRIKLNDKAGAILLEHSDAVLFANYQVSTTQADSANKANKKVRGVGGGNRVVYTSERPAWVAKNRYNMPEQIIVPNARAETPEAAKEAWVPVWDMIHGTVGV